MPPRDSEQFSSSRGGASHPFTNRNIVKQPGANVLQGKYRPTENLENRLVEDTGQYLERAVQQRSRSDSRLAQPKSHQNQSHLNQYPSSSATNLQDFHQDHATLSTMRHPSRVGSSAGRIPADPASRSPLATSIIRDHGATQGGGQFPRERHPTGAISSVNHQRASSGVLGDVLMRGRALRNTQQQNAPKARQTTRVTQGSPLQHPIGILKRKSTGDISAQPYKMIRQNRLVHANHEVVSNSSTGINSTEEWDRTSRGRTQNQQRKQSVRSRSRSQAPYPDWNEQTISDPDVIMLDAPVRRGAARERAERQISPGYGYPRGRSSSVVPQTSHGRSHPFSQHGYPDVQVTDNASRNSRPRSQSRPPGRRETISQPQQPNDTTSNRQLPVNYVEQFPRDTRSRSVYPPSSSQTAPGTDTRYPLVIDDQEDFPTLREHSSHDSPTDKNQYYGTQRSRQRWSPAQQMNANDRPGTAVDRDMNTNNAQRGEDRHVISHNHLVESNQSRQGVDLRSGLNDQHENLRASNSTSGRGIVKVKAPGINTAEAALLGKRHSQARNETQELPDFRGQNGAKDKAKASRTTDMRYGSRHLHNYDSDSSEDLQQAMRQVSKRAAIQKPWENSTHPQIRMPQPCTSHGAPAAVQPDVSDTDQSLFISDNDSILGTNSSTKPGKQAGLVNDRKYDLMRSMLMPKFGKSKETTQHQDKPILIAQPKPSTKIDTGKQATKKTTAAGGQGTNLSLDIFNLVNDPKSEQHVGAVIPPPVQQVDDLFGIQDPSFAKATAPIPLPAVENPQPIEAPVPSFNISFESKLGPVPDIEPDAGEVPSAKGGNNDSAQQYHDVDATITQITDSGKSKITSQAVDRSNESNKARAGDNPRLLQSHSSSPREPDSDDEVRTLQAEVASIKKRTEAAKARKDAKEAKRKTDQELQAEKEATKAKEMSEKVTKDEASGAGVVKSPNPKAQKQTAKPDTPQSTAMTKVSGANDTAAAGGSDIGTGMTSMSMKDAVRLMGRHKTTSKHTSSAGAKRPSSVLDKIRSLGKKENERLKIAQATLQLSSSHMETDSEQIAEIDVLQSPGSGHNVQRSRPHRPYEKRAPIPEDKITEHDYILVELKLEGLPWKDIHVQWMELTGETRASDFVRTRWRRLQNTFAVLAEPSHRTPAEAPAVQNTTHNDRISELVAKASTRVPAAAVTKNARPTTGGKTITPEMERRMNETIYYEEESEEERQDSPITDEDRVHYVYFTKRQIVQAGEEIDEDDAAWTVIGEEHTSLSEANHAATREMGLQRGNTFIVPDKWSFEQQMGMAKVVGSSDEGEIHIVVDRRIRDFNEGVLPKHKQGWLPRKVWDVCETRTVTVTTTEDASEPMEGIVQRSRNHDTNSVGETIIAPEEKGVAEDSPPSGTSGAAQNKGAPATSESVILRPETMDMDLFDADANDHDHAITNIEDLFGSDGSEDGEIRETEKADGAVDPIANPQQGLADDMDLDAFTQAFEEDILAGDAAEALAAVDVIGPNFFELPDAASAPGPIGNDLPSSPPTTAPVHNLQTPHPSPQSRHQPLKDPTTTTTTTTTHLATESPKIHTHLDMANRTAGSHYLSLNHSLHRSHLRRTYELAEEIRREREEMDQKLDALEAAGERFTEVVVWEGERKERKGRKREKGVWERVEVKIEVVERVLVGPRNL